MYKISPIRTCLIGFGNVGGGLNSTLTNSTSHVNSILSNKEFQLVAVVDPALTGTEKIPKGVITVNFLQELQGTYFDLIVVATPTTTHLAICKLISEQFKPKAILIEKPAGENLKEFGEIKEYCKGTPLTLVNYNRNYDPVVLREIIQMRDSNTLKGTVYYSNGAINNASHALALLIAAFGEPSRIYNMTNTVETCSVDSNLDFIVKFDNRLINFFALKESNYSIFRIELYGDDRCWIYDSALELGQIRFREEDTLKGKFRLSSEILQPKIAASNRFMKVYEYISKALRDESYRSYEFGASLDLAQTIHKVIDQVQKI